MSQDKQNSSWTGWIGPVAGAFIGAIATLIAEDKIPFPGMFVEISELKSEILELKSELKKVRSELSEKNDGLRSLKAVQIEQGEVFLKLMESLKAVSSSECKNSGILTDENSEIVETDSLGISTKNFIAKVSFRNPDTPQWSYGLMFRYKGSFKQYRLYVQSDGEWYLRLYSDDNDEQELIEKYELSGQIIDFRESPNYSNDLLILVANDTGMFFINDSYLGLLDLSHKITDGNIFAAVNFESGDTRGSRFVYEDFCIWRL